MPSKSLFSQFANLLLVANKPVLGKGHGSKSLLNRLTHLALGMMALHFNLRPSLRKYLKGADGWINFSVGIFTETGTVAQAIVFKDGRVRVFANIPRDVDVIMKFVDEEALKEMARSTPNEILNLILKNRMILEGNLSCLQLFNYYIALIMGRVHQRMLERVRRADKMDRRKLSPTCKTDLSRALQQRRKYRMQGASGIDPGVKFLTDPYLSGLSLEDFPRLKIFLDRHFSTQPEVCPERPKLMTAWYRKNGFEKDREGKPWFPELRQSLAFQYLMENKQPILGADDLLAGTTTTKEIGATVFPDGQGTMFWAELNSSGARLLCPYRCDGEAARILHHEVFPFWLHRTFREYVRTNFHSPLCQRIDERFVAYFVWKSVGVSHTIPNFKRLLHQGTSGIMAAIRSRMKDPGLDQDQQQTLQAMLNSLAGMATYAVNLAREAERKALMEEDPRRKNELLRLAEVCRKVPQQPAESLDEAVNAVWICWVALHNENANTGLSVGRLDQLFQPYFEYDMIRCTTAEEQAACIRHAIELVGCLFMRMADHVPLLPDIANYLFGGASSTQAVTIGGITPQGEDAVNDMTYIILKVTEMLAIRDANLNARYHPGKNSDQYLRRLCEVNLITAATPIMQGDEAVFKALRQHGYPEEAVRDWAATGCVEPTIQGRHFSHTATILLNMVAAMEMALNNGRHPLMRWDVGPKTGGIEDDSFPDFESFYRAWAVQQDFIVEQAVTLNNLLGKAHQQYRPTPLLSALIDGTIESGRDVVQGGACHNSGGTSNIGLADVTDSLLVIKKLVFDEKKVSFRRLKAAVDTDFKHEPALLAMIQKQVSLFGSGEESALAMANRVAKTVHDAYARHRLYRGGSYTAGFWSMSQHVAYGSLSGTLPSGRLAGKAFTPGLTPSPKASKNFLDNIAAVAKLDPENLDNNLAFNVKLAVGPQDSREKTVEQMRAYVKTYFEMGGMQIQFNTVDSETLKDAMAHPENYRNLMVRISGYNAYFVTLNRDIQTELVERAEYGLT